MRAWIARRMPNWFLWTRFGSWLLGLSVEDGRTEVRLYTYRDEINGVPGPWHYVDLEVGEGTGTHIVSKWWSPRRLTDDELRKITNID